MSWITVNTYSIIIVVAIAAGVLFLIFSPFSDKKNVKYGVAGVFAFVAVVAGFTWWQNVQDEENGVNEVAESMGFAVHGVDVNNNTVKLEITPGCVYTVGYVSAPDDTYAINAGSTKFNGTVPVFQDGFASEPSRDSCDPTPWDTSDDSDEGAENASDDEGS